MKSTIKFLVLTMLLILAISAFAGCATLEHTWAEATCTAPKTCTGCGATEGEALGHTEQILAGKAATCTETGLTEGKSCSVCEAIIVAQEEIPALDHDMVVDAPQTATCTEAGLTEGAHCSRCDYKVEQTEVPALGHDMVTDAAVAPNCTTDGLTEGSHCSRCDEKVAQEIVPALGHDMVVDAAVASTCTETGLTEGSHCSRCDHKVAQEIVPVLGHDMVTDAAVAPTCTETGLTEGSHCSRCDHKVAQEIVPAAGHNLVSNGESGICTVCNAVITAKIGATEYETFAEAYAAANAGDTITLCVDITVSAKIVLEKSIVIDGNGFTITYTGSDRAIDVPNNADAKIDVTIKNLTVDCTASYCQRGINYNDDGTLTLDKVTVKGNSVTYALNLPGSSDNAIVVITDSALTGNIALNVWGENATITATNTVFTSVDKAVAENYSAITLNSDGSTIANGTVININGGKIIALDENGELSSAIHNGTATGKVNVSAETEIVGEYKVPVAIVVYEGYTDFYSCTSLQAAIAKAIETGGSVRLIADIALDEAITIPAGAVVVIDLNGHTITGTDTATGSFGLITNKGELTITGNGTITLKATNDRDWNAYSSVISNQPGGKLIVENGTIEHLGGTDMAYAIDNLTNGKGTYAETVVNGGTIKSTYRAIRMFLNGVEAQNILTVNGGTIEGANKSIWMQDPSKNANTGKLTVGANAVLNGNVNLTVTEGSTEWPVEVSIAASALAEGSEVLTSNVPAQYVVQNVDGVWTVIKAVATVNGVGYTSLEAALAAAKEEDTVVLLSDIALTAPIVIAKDAVVTIDLAGFVLSYESTTMGEAMITNHGQLGICDSGETGEIFYNYVGEADSSYGKGNYTISNGGNLVILGGKIHIADLKGHAKYPVDNNSTTGNATLIVSGGHLYNYNTAAIRMFCNSTTYTNTVVIDGGLIEGYSAIWMQNPNNKTVNGQLLINGGEIRTTAKAYVNGTATVAEVASKIYCTIDGEGGAWDETSFVQISGGLFNENVYLETAAPAVVEIGEGATFNGYVKIHEHEFVGHSCDTDGVCACGATKPAAHTITYVAAVEAINCQTTGHNEYWECTACGAYFGDADASWQVNPAWIFSTGACVRPEGAADCATVPCTLCGEDTYGEGDHDTGVAKCQNGHCSKCGADIEGYGCSNYDTPACEDGECYYCGGFVAGFGHENGAWALCQDGECSYGCGLFYPAAEDHVDEDGDDYCDNCWNHLKHDVDPCLGGECSICWTYIEPAHEYFYPCDAHCMNCYELTNPDAAHNITFIEGYDATCTANGMADRYECSLCGYCWLDEGLTLVANRMNVVIPAPGHAYMFECDAHCMNCGELTNEDAAHTIVAVDAKDATCTANGNVAYWTCSDCGAAWLDEALTLVANRMSVTLPATGHAYFYPCDPVCMNCYELTNEDAAHTIVAVEAKAATCDANGNVAHWYCSDCGSAWLDEACTMMTNLRSVNIPATGHADENSDYKCDSCSTKMLPADGTALTIPQALAIAKLAGSTYTTDKYYITGIIKNVYDTTWGNLYLKDAEGNEICIYGLYTWGEGTTNGTRYDKMDYKPLAGDELTVYTVLGMYNTTCQGKNAWIDEVVAHEHVANKEATCDTASLCALCDAVMVEALGHTEPNADGECDRCGTLLEGEAAIKYELVTNVDDFTTGTYIIVNKAKGVALDVFSSGWVNVVSVSATNGVITGDYNAWTVTVNGSSVTLKDAKGNTIKPKSGNNNGIQTGSYNWAFTWNSNGTVTFKGTGSDTTTLACNAGSENKVRAYKNTTVSGNTSTYPSEFYVYKLVEN